MRGILCIALMGLSWSVWADPTCEGLAAQPSGDYTSLVQRLQAQHRAGGGPDMARLAACGLEEEDLRRHQCLKAYGQQNLEFLLRHCPDEAWSLARAQCERKQEGITPHYAAFCRAFGRE